MRQSLSGKKENIGVVSKFQRQSGVFVIQGRIPCLGLEDISSSYNK